MKREDLVPAARIAFLAVLLPAVLAAQEAKSLVDQKVEVEYEKSVDFSKYKTYAWVPFQEPAKRPTNHARITRAMEHEMELKGLVKAVDPPRADLFLEYKGHVEKKLRGTPSQQESVWQPSSPKFTVNFDRVSVGTLVIRLWDGTSKDVVWSARGSEMIQEGDQPKSVIDAAVKRLLASYPPKPAPGPE